MNSTYQPKLFKTEGVLNLTDRYAIIGFDDDQVFEVLEHLLRFETHKSFNTSIKDVFGEPNGCFDYEQDAQSFRLKHEIIPIQAIKMLGGAGEYVHDIEQFCKPKKGTYYFDYGNQYYSYYSVGIEDASIMWKVIKQVLRFPKYAIIYEK